MTKSDDHLATVRALAEAEPAEPDDGSAVTGLLQRLCRAAARDLSAGGVGISLAADGDLMLAAASSTATAAVEELQFALGEGPCISAFDLRSPVLIPDLSEAASGTWPVYASAAHDHGMRAVFAFPLHRGVSRLGALDVYRKEEGALTAWAMARALTYTELAMLTILDGRRNPAELAALAVDLTEGRLEVYQAEGMLMVQFGVSAERALALLRAHAFAHDRKIGEVADDVIARRVILGPDDP
jgi:hypothetical protein